MARHLFSFLFAFSLGICCIGGKESSMKKLRADLLRDYDKYVRPVRNYRNATVLKLGFSPIKLIEIDEDTTTMVLGGWNKMVWTDEYLVWNPKDFDGISVIRLPINDIWKPDVTTYNGKRTTFDKQQEAYALVFSHGEVVWVPSGQFETYCDLVSKYPKSTQMCSVLFGSWTYSGMEIDLQIYKANQSNLEDFVNENPYWEITSVTVERQNKYYNCCVEPYPSIRYNLTLRQRTNVHQYLCKTLRIASDVLFLCMFWVPLSQKMLIGSFALVLCSICALQTAWTAHTLNPHIISTTTAEYAVGLAAIIIQVIIINIGQPKKPMGTKILNILSTGFGKALSLVQNQAKEAPNDLPSKGVTEFPSGKVEETTLSDGNDCKTECFYLSTILDRILFVVFAVIFLVVGNYC